MKRKRNPTLLLMLLSLNTVLLLFSGCVPAPPKNASDELKLHNWKLKSTSDEYSGTLLFSDTEAELLVTKKGVENHIKGEYFTDKERLVIVTDEYGVLSFCYRIESDNLFLEYSDKCIAFVKTSNGQ